VTGDAYLARVCVRSRCVPQWAGDRPRRISADAIAFIVTTRLDLEVDDDLAVHAPAGLELGRAADLLNREARRDRHSKPARRGQAGDLFTVAPDPSMKPRPVAC